MKNISIPYLSVNGELKNIDFSPWGGIEGFLQATSEGRSTAERSVELRKLVPAYARMITMISNEIANLPFDFVDENENIFDTTSNWQNRLGGIPSPSALITKIAGSLAATGRAYLIPSWTSRALELTYVTPWSMTPRYDAKGKLIYFDRKPGGRYPLDKIAWFFYSDDSVEQDSLPEIYPGQTARLAAEIIAAMDTSLQTWGTRGFIPPTILAAKGMPNPAERERAENWWNLFLRGWTKTVAKIVNAEIITPQKIGDGGAELRGAYNQIKRQLIEDIGLAGGIPTSLFMSNAANYATAQSDKAAWYSSGEFVNIWQCIESVFTEKILKRFGLRMRFNLSSVTTTDEAEKISSVSGLAGTLSANPNTTIALMEYFGYEMDDEQREMLLEAVASDKGQENEIMPSPAAEPQAQPVPVEADNDENALADELLKWMNYEKKHAGQPHRKFDCKVVPPALELRIIAGLESGASIDSIFADAAGQVGPIVLAKSIDRLKNG